MLYRQFWGQVTDGTATSRSAQRAQLAAAGVRYSVLLAGVGLTVAIIFFVTWPPAWAIKTLLLPDHERSFGFRGGLVPYNDVGQVTYGIVEVAPTGRLGEAGVKPGDIPVNDSGEWKTSFIGALEEASAGNEAHFRVVSGIQGWRTGESRQIVLKPTKRAK